MNTTFLLRVVAVIKSEVMHLTKSIHPRSGAVLMMVQQVQVFQIGYFITTNKLSRFNKHQNLYTLYIIT